MANRHLSSLKTPENPTPTLALKNSILPHSIHLYIQTRSVSGIVLDRLFGKGTLSTTYEPIRFLYPFVHFAHSKYT